MLVYTIQHIEVFKTLKKQGFYKTNEKFICEESFLFAYNWLNTQAKKRIPSWGTNRPIWVWEKRPDLRGSRFIYDSQSPKKQKFVLLTLEVPDSHILFSEFELWHSVLNHVPVPYSGRDSQRLDKILKPYENLSLEKYPKKAKKIVLDTWPRILKTSDNDFSKFTNYVVDKKRLKFQGIISHIDKTMVVKVQEFWMINTYLKKK